MLKALTTAISPAAPAHRVACAVNCESNNLRTEMDKGSSSRKDVCHCLSIDAVQNKNGTHLHYIGNKEHFQWIAMIELFQSIPSSGSLRDADMVICCEHCAAIKVHVSPLVMCPASAPARLKKASQKATKARRRRRLAPWHIETIEK